MAQKKEGACSACGSETTRLRLRQNRQSRTILKLKFCKYCNKQTPSDLTMEGLVDIRYGNNKYE